MTTTSDHDMHAAALAAIAHYTFTAEHFTNPGADYWGQPGCNVGDAAWDAFTQTDHFGETGGADWSQRCWDYFLESFEAAALDRLASS